MMAPGARSGYRAPSFTGRVQGMARYLEVEISNPTVDGTELQTIVHFDYGQELTDSQALHHVLCEYDPGETYSVHFGNSE